MISVHDAAERLGVSDRRVRAMIDSGRLKAQRLGRAWMIEPSALGGVDGERAAGRPLNPESAWAELFGGRQVQGANAALLRSRYRGRSERHELDGPDIEASVNDPNVRSGGWVAARSFDELLDEDRSQLKVIYVGASSYDAWRERHWLVPSPAPRILVHVVGDDIGRALRSRPGRSVPARVVAVDIAELGGARPIEAALRIWNR
jgi:excisionase family DNA binding protein